MAVVVEAEKKQEDIQTPTLIAPAAAGADLEIMGEREERHFDGFLRLSVLR